MKTQKNLPSISVVIATYNSEKTIEWCLTSIRQQEYPQSLMEIIIADGGSKDRTREIAKKYHAKVVIITSNKQDAEYNRAIGVHQSKNEIIAILDHDNILPHPYWLVKMIQPFLDNREIVGVETIRYHYDKTDSLLGRYFALLGAGDPLPFYLGKADRLSYLYNTPQEYGCYQKARVEDKGEYYIVSFTKDAIPTLGSNGFLIRRDLLLNQAQSDLDHFFHIDVNVDLIKKGYSSYAFIKDTLHHRMEERGILDYFRRRIIFMEKYHLVDLTKRRYSVYEKKDFLKLVQFIVISVTILKPLADALRGFFKIRDVAWFLHPIMCFGTTFVYGFTFIKFKYDRVRKLILK